jgi:ribonucleoside-diphosphate reductase alpha chain
MGIEPIKSNYFIKDLAKSKTIYKNPYLELELEKYGLNTPAVWEGILKKDGSVQHLDFPTKEVFKSFIESLDANFPGMQLINIDLVLP